MKRLAGVVVAFILAVALGLAAAPPAQAVHSGLYAFRYLGAWIDLYDQGIPPAAGAADMRARGVRTIFIETARWNSSGSFDNPAWIGQWVDEAYRNGMKIVGWYLPGYGDITRDVRRTTAIATFRSPLGHRFHAVAIDIEDKREVNYSLHRFNEGVARHLSRVRYRLTQIFGTSSYPVGAITPAPLAMALRPDNWRGFPWRAIARWANVVMPMAYWSFRDDCSTVRQHCPYYYLRDNAIQARHLTGLRVHAIGGVGDRSTERQVLAAVRGTFAAHAYGGSLYDYRTTATDFWSPLSRLNSL